VLHHAHVLTPSLSRRHILEEVLEAEREACALLDDAARLSRDIDDRRLFRRLAEGAHAAVRELTAQRESLEAEEFVQRALDV
jgi:hypothetical protein